MNPTITNEGPRPPSITAPLIQKNKETDFLTAATAAIDRGFAVTPVSPFKKCGVLSRWQVHPGKTQSEINQYAKDYPNYNVGVVSRRGVGNLMFLDIDSEGVLEQIEAETGHQLPLTYTVQSRPQSAPWKRHLYFKQTRYSYDAFGRDKSREINVKDLSAKPDARGVYPNRYDVKGIGGGGLVVAAGSVRDTGEVYEGNDAPTVTVPDWLVDWVVEDRRKYRSGTAKIREAVKTKQIEGIQAKTAKEPLPEYTKDEINIALWSRACSFASLGTRRQTIKRLLKEQVEDFMKDGEAFVAEWADRIHEIAFDPELRIGKLRREFLPKNRPQDRPKTYIKPTEPVTGRSDGSIIVWPTIHRHALWQKAIEGFPNDLSASEVRTRLRKALQKHPSIPFSERGAQRAMEKAGFSSRNVGGTYVWSRKPGREQEQGEQYRDHPIHRTIR